MGSAIYPHRPRGRILSRNPLIDGQQIAVFFANRFEPQPVDRVGKIQIDTLPVWADAAAFVTYFLCVPRCDIAGYEVPETGVSILQVIVALTLGNIFGSPRIALLFRYPHASIIPERLRHQCQLRLMLAAQRDAGRMNLRNTR